MKNQSLRERLLRNIDDSDLALRQLAEIVVISKESRGSADVDVGLRGAVEIVAAKSKELVNSVQLGIFNTGLLTLFRNAMFGEFQNPDTPTPQRYEICSLGNVIYSL